MIIFHRVINLFVNVMTIRSIYGYVLGSLKCTVMATCYTSLSAQKTPLRDALEFESKTSEDFDQLTNNQCLSHFDSQSPHFSTNPLA